MATFILNQGYDDEREIVAFQHSEAGSFVIFYGDDMEQVFAVPTKRVQSITRKSGSE